MTQNSGHITAKKLTGSPRKSKNFGEGRICSNENCKQVMSKYNHNKYCYVHAPAKIPRTRGQILR